LELVVHHQPRQNASPKNGFDGAKMRLETKHPENTKKGRFWE
jgi:hypothetical protein